MKIFAVGLAKTGTSSLAEALQNLNFSVCTNHVLISESVKKFRNHEIEKPLDNLSKEYDAYICRTVLNDSPCIELAEFYPDSKFILTTRDIEGWFNSKLIHLLWNRLSGQQVKWTEINMAQERKIWYSHHKMIRDYFNDKPDRLLVMNICNSEGYPKLCNFLKVPLPIKKTFPKRNTSYKRLHEIYEYFI